MNEDAFIIKNRDNWSKLEKYNEQVVKKRMHGLSRKEIQEYAELFKLAGHDLSYSRTHFGDCKTTQYLNQTVGISHNLFYTKEKSEWHVIRDYFLKIFPEKVIENKKYIYFSILIFLAGFAISFTLVLLDTSNFRLFFPESGLTGSATWDYPTMSSFIMVNNIRVSFMAFALGIIFGAGTLYILFLNGAVIGSLTAAVSISGSGMLRYLSLILPHGVLELFAIFISGAAGLLIGRSLLIPGNLKRSDSLKKGAKEASAMIPGAVVFLIIAGIIEGFFTPLNIHIAIKLTFAALTFFLLLLYIHAPRHRQSK